MVFGKELTIFECTFLVWNKEFMRNLWSVDTSFSTPFRSTKRDTNLNYFNDIFEVYEINKPQFALCVSKKFLRSTNSKGEVIENLPLSRERFIDFLHIKLFETLFLSFLSTNKKTSWTFRHLICHSGLLPACRQEIFSCKYLNCQNSCFHDSSIRYESIIE